MTVRDIVSIGHPVLRQVAEPIDPADIDTPEVQGLIGDLIDTMRHANGAGLAANQIGVPRRVAVIEVNDNPRYPYKPSIPLTVVINPVLTPVDDETVIINEGCLSVPLRGDVVRFVTIRAQYLDQHGTAHDRELRGLTAGTFQHECDHLDGTLITDRADPLTLATWDNFSAYQRDQFIERITAFVATVGS